jgi:hypothetical protein
MDMSGKFTIAEDDHGHAMAMARAMAELADQLPSSPTTAIAWRDGEAIAVDLTRPLPAPRERMWPEHIAIAALFVSTWALAAGQLKF